MTDRQVQNEKEWKVLGQLAAARNTEVVEEERHWVSAKLCGGTPRLLGQLVARAFVECKAMRQEARKIWFYRITEAGLQAWKETDVASFVRRPSRASKGLEEERAALREAEDSEAKAERDYDAAPVRRLERLLRLARQKRARIAKRVAKLEASSC